MAKAETEIAHAIMIAASKKGDRLFKVVRGLFYTKDSVMSLLAAVKTCNIGRIIAAAKNLRQIKAGLLADGASDLIGFKRVIITQEMVGQLIAQFYVREVKTPTGKVSPEQQNFVDFVNENGGDSGIARSVADI